MQEALQTVNDQPSTFPNIIRRLWQPVLARRRLAYILTGAVFFAALTALVASATTNRATDGNSTQHRQVPTTDAGSLADPVTPADSGPAPPADITESNSTQVEVNGRDIAVPADGSTHRTFTDDDTKTTVDASSSQHSSGSSTSNTTNITVHSSSSSSTQSDP